jgi:hypothetical protein
VEYASFLIQLVTMLLIARWNWMDRFQVNSRSRSQPKREVGLWAVVLTVLFFPLAYAWLVCYTGLLSLSMSYIFIIYIRHLQFSSKKIHSLYFLPLQQRSLNHVIYTQIPILKTFFYFYFLYICICHTLKCTSVSKGFSTLNIKDQTVIYALQQCPTNGL